MNFEQKYLKYKEKYLSLRRQIISIQSGGAYEKYILLSCPEFNSLVDDILIADNADESIKDKETQISKIDMTKYKKFLDDIKVELDPSKPEFPDQDKICKELYLSDLNNYETEHFYRGFINWKTYNDKTPDIKMNENTTTKLRGAKVVYFGYFSFNEPNVTPIINQFLFLNALNHYGVSEINIVLPYFPVGTMERIVGEGEIPTAYSLAHMLNNIPEGAAKNSLYMYDIHAPCSRFFFQTNTRPILLTIFPQYLKHIKESYPEKKTKIVEVGEGAEVTPENYNIIVFPDDGAVKRFGKMISSEFKTILCTKIRDGDKRIIKIDQEGLIHFAVDKTRNKIINLFVIDDLVQSGGTLLETFDGLKNELADAKYNLLETNVRYIAMVTHSIFPNDSEVKNFFERTKAMTEVEKKRKKEAVKAAEEHREPIAISDPAKVFRLITTNSRPIRTSYIETNYKEQITVINLAKSLHTVFSETENKEYYGRFSIKN